jgi:hypothetical protein
MINSGIMPVLNLEEGKKVDGVEILRDQMNLVPAPAPARRPSFPSEGMRNRHELGEDWWRER